MELTTDERKVLQTFVVQHLKEVEKNEKISNNPPILLGAEVRYEEFLERLLEKLQKE